MYYINKMYFTLYKLSNNIAKKSLKDIIMVLERNRKKFIELAEKRVDRAIKSMRLIGNLANRNNYVYEDEDVKMIIMALKKSLADMSAKFENASRDEDIKFRLRK